MAAVQLSTGAVAAVKEGTTDQPIRVKLSNITNKEGGKWTCNLTDGSGHSIKAFLLSQLKRDLDAGALQLQDGAIVSVTDFTKNNLKGEEVLMLVNLTLLQQGDGKGSGDAGAATTDAGTGARADQTATPAGAGEHAKQQQQAAAGTPLAAARGGALKPLTPGPTPSPSEEVRGTPATSAAASSLAPRQPQFTPGTAATTGSPITVVSSRAGVTPIAALNPYQKNWCIKAKVVRKGPARSFAGRSSSGAGGGSRVFNAELADAAGSQVQATFWREAADKYADSLEEGKVYYFTTFSVKPANKAYSSVRADYELHLDGRTEVEEAADQSGISGEAAVELVPFERLLRHVGKKAPVDVLGVVTQVGALGTVKRKVDASELARRDITLADESKRSVVLTLWADNATRGDLDGCVGRLLQVTRVRVNDFNGCALSAVSRSELTIDPDTPEATALKSWWAAEGSSAALEPLGQAGGGAGGGPRSNKLELLDAVVPSGELPPPEAKPTYHDVVVAVAQVLDERVMYLANPENGKKVEPRDGRYWCEADGAYVDHAEWRYVLRARVADASREAWVNIFNAQGQQLLGLSANEAEAAGQADPGAMPRLAKAAQWSEWSMVVAAKSREYQGERNMRYTVARMSPLDYAAEGHRLLQLIQQQTRGA